MSTPAVVAIDMGYGHLRAAAPLADALGTPILEMDRAPLADAQDEAFWRRARAFYEPLTRYSQIRGVGLAPRALLEAITDIPSAWPPRDASGPTAGTRWMAKAARDGRGRRLAEWARKEDRLVLSTFYAAALFAEAHGWGKVACLVTDSDLNRVWAPPAGGGSRILYLAPSERARRRLESYGVAPERIRLTGFPLPHELVGGRDGAIARRNLAARLVRLDPKGAFRAAFASDLSRELPALPAAEAGRPPLVTVAIGGAGAQVNLARKLIAALTSDVRAGRLRLALVAGRRGEVARSFRTGLAEARLQEGEGVTLLEERDVRAYFRRFNALLAETDVLWSKPSEITFFSALGLPLLAAPPVGVHEGHNLRWAQDQGAALPEHDPSLAAHWLRDWLEEGTLAHAAWCGFRRLPRNGLYEILDATSASPRPGLE